MGTMIIVEGKNDKKTLRRLLSDNISILCTFGTLNSDKIEVIKNKAKNHEIYIFTDNDPSGKKIRAQLSDLFPDAVQIYTRKGYAGVEGTPEEYLIHQLEKAGLDEYLLPVPPDMS